MCKRILSLILIVFMVFCNQVIVFGDENLDENFDESLDESLQSEELQQATFKLYRNKSNFSGICFEGFIEEDITEGLSDEEKNENEMILQYSLDGNEYYNIDYASQSMTTTKDFSCITPNMQPYRNFLNKEYSKFYLRYYIPAGNYKGYTTSVLIKSQPAEEENKKLPEDCNLQCYYDNTNIDYHPLGPTANYYVTIKEGTSEEELCKALPTSILGRTYIMAKNDILIATLSPKYSLDFTLSDDVSLAKLKAGNCAIIGDSSATAIAEEIPMTIFYYDVDKISNDIIDYESEITFYNYDVKINDIVEPLNLKVDVVEADTLPTLQLNDPYQADILSYNMYPKPDGADSLTAEYSLDGGETWIADIKQHLTIKDLNTKAGNFHMDTNLNLNSSPLKEYYAGDLKGFLFRVKINGGLYDGYSETVSFPDDYEYIKPVENGDGGTGNRGDAASGDGNNTSSNLTPPNIAVPEITIPKEENMEEENSEEENLEEENLDGEEVEKENPSKSPLAAQVVANKLVPSEKLLNTIMRDNKTVLEKKTKKTIETKSDENSSHGSYPQVVVFTLTITILGGALIIGKAGFFGKLMKIFTAILHGQ